MNNQVICPNCDGYGSVMGTESTHGCCNKFLRDGSCCGNAIEVPVEVQIICELCGGRGFLEEPRP